MEESHARARVTHGYLAGERPLFASHHAPAAGAPARNVAYVVCPPLHLELIQSGRSMRECAETLAAAGFHVMRIDYDGTGESVGSTDTDPERVAAWLASVRRAVAAMAAIPNVESVGLVGVRIGAAFALETATQVDVSHLVLWEPPMSGASYGREMEILASSSPQRVPGGLVAAGYWLSQETLAELGRLDLEKMKPRGRPEVLLVYRGDRKPPPRLLQHLERLECKTTLAHVPGHKEMLVMPHKSVVPRAILAAIRDWALERSRVASEASSKAAPALAPEANVGGLTWRPFWFGAKDHLFGVLTEPASGAKRDVSPVLLLTGGVTPRTAGNRSYVTLAQRLAARGHTVLRMDVASIGESGTASGVMGNGNDGFPPSVVDDARAGFERVCTSAGPGTKVWLLGLCSGAYAAFQTILDDTRARGVFLMNPVALRTLPTTPEEGADAGAPNAMEKVDQLEQMQRYWQVMRSPESWKKLLSGKADVRNIANVVAARLGARLASAKEGVAARFGRAPQGLAGDVAALLARGVSVNLVFSEGDPGHALIVTELGARLDELMSKGMVVKVFAGADHNFHEMASRAELLDWVVATIG
jgi:alpha/beta superfamily hydrolase